jgi:hypothetical protein
MEKQDCELNAAKRWLGAHGAALAARCATLLQQFSFWR